MFHSQLQDTYSQVQRLVTYASNKPTKHKDAKSKLETLRSYRNRIAMFKEISHCPLIVEIFLEAITSQHFGCGNCPEQSSAVFCDLLKQAQFEKSIEIINVHGTNTKLVSDTHYLVVVDRQSHHDLDKPERWINAKGVDAWGEKIFFHDFTKEELAKSGKILLHTAKISSFYRRETPLSEEEYKAIINYLRVFSNGLERVESVEFSGWIKKIREEISKLSDLKDKPPVQCSSFVVKHYDKSVEYQTSKFNSCLSLFSKCTGAQIIAKELKALQPIQFN